MSILAFIAFLVTFTLLKESKFYCKDLGGGIRVKHIANALVYLLMFSISPLMAIALFLLCDAKSLYNKLKTKGE